MVADPKSLDGKVATARYAKTSYDDFKAMATDSTLTENEKLGFPDALRAPFEDAIWDDIAVKLPALLGSREKTVLDIGPGCGPLARRIIRDCTARDHTLVMIDHVEMLDQLPQSARSHRVGGRFPNDIARIKAIATGFDVILCYSLLQIVIVDANPFDFVDQTLSLLNPGGRALFGDIPNVSMLRRFLASSAGADYHSAYMRTDEPPVVSAFEHAHGRIDDGMMVGLLIRARQAGFDAYVLPQSPGAPMANRREDLLIVRP